MTQTTPLAPDSSTTLIQAVFEAEAARSSSTRADRARARAAWAIAAYRGTGQTPPADAGYEQSLLVLAKGGPAPTELVTLARWTTELEEAADAICNWVGWPDRIAAWLALPESQQLQADGVMPEARLGPLWYRSPVNATAAIRELLAKDARTAEEYARRLARYGAAEAERAALAASRQRSFEKDVESFIASWIAWRETDPAKMFYRSGQGWNVTTSLDLIGVVDLSTDPRTAEEYARRLQEAAAKAAEDLEAEEARQDRKTMLLDAIVKVFGDAPTRAGWEDGLIRTADVVRIVWRQLFREGLALPTDPVNLRWHSVTHAKRPTGQGSPMAEAGILGVLEEITVVEQVSPEAYKVLQERRADITEALVRHRPIGVSTAGHYLQTVYDGARVTWRLEKTTYSGRELSGREAAYTAVCRVGFDDEALAFEARCVLAPCPKGES